MKIYRVSNAVIQSQVKRIISKAERPVVYGLVFCCFRGLGSMRNVPIEMSVFRYRIGNYQCMHAMVSALVELPLMAQLSTMFDFR